MDNDTALSLLILTILVIFLFPALIAFWRRHPNRWVILLLNVFLGATGFVWFACLIWAFRAIHFASTSTGSHGGESGLNIVANDFARPQTHLLPVQVTAMVDGTLERLERLKKLHENGALDDRQFERMRSAILPAAIDNTNGPAPRGRRS
ncbi:hypothetical protein ASD50_21200 [Mesorhizobium sp. Root552]|jgi:hypothetical protein|uniref:superinfection immunity protein n=1 Tax=Mesorhizobium sp. Root552 TaxID=1736555 RepID=UPI0006FA0D20|nr:superinfection immunity protein [Mesorhizobium sp. Root552]KQZ22778.1 hypothetical protein ASD50_21200 [Mesorhizobium sp. Root552]